MSKTSVSTNEDAYMDTFTVRLLKQPTATVLISSSATDAGVSSGIFKWDDARTMTGVDASTADSDQSYTNHAGPRERGRQRLQRTGQRDAVGDERGQQRGGDE